MAKSKRKSQLRSQTQQKGKSKQNSQVSTPIETPSQPEDDYNSLLQILLLVCSSLMFARLLIPAESSEKGDTILFVFFWLILLSITCWIGIRERLVNTITFDWIDLSLFLITILGPLLSLLTLAVRGGNLRSGIYSLWEWIGTFLTVFLLRKLMLSTRSSLPVILLLGLIVPLSGLGLYQHYVSYPQSRQAVNPIAQQWNELEQQVADASDSARPRLERKQFQLQKKMIQLGIPLDKKTRTHLLRRLNTSDEPTARFALANTLGGILAFAAIIILSLLIELTKQSDKLLRLILGVIMLVLVLYCLLLTKSRTALIAVVAGTTLLLLFVAAHFSKIKRKHFAMGLAIVGLLLLLIPLAIFTGSLDVEVITESGKSFRYRMEYWSASWMMLKEHFVVGVGPGNFRESYLEFKLPESSEVILDPHNLWLDAWSQGGLTTITGLLILVMCVIKNAINSCFTKRIDSNRLDLEESEGDSKDSVTSESNPHQSAAPEHSPSSKQIIISSALLVLFAGILSSPSISLPFAELIGWGFLLAVTASFWTWISNRFNLLPLSLCCASTALFLHLHGAGGYSMPIVIQLLLLFSTASIVATPVLTVSSRIIFPVGLSLGIVLTALCWWSAVAPKFAQGIAESELYQSRSMNQTHRILQDWAKQDTINPEPWRRMASFLEDNAIKQHSTQQLQKAIDAMQQYTQRTPLYYDGYREQSRLLKQLFIWSQDQETLLEAIQFQKQVIRRYPNDTHHHLELAQLYELLGEKNSMRDSALKAEELNNINKKHGHTDRVLTPQEQEILLKLKVIGDENPNKSE